MNLSSLATSALATTRSTFKGLAEAAVATGDGTTETTGQGQARAERAEKRAKPEVKAAGPADAPPAKRKGVRLGTVLDAYA
jgi:hypothetical protein